MYLRSRGSRRGAVELAAGSGRGEPAVIAAPATARALRPSDVWSSPGSLTASSLAAIASPGPSSSAGGSTPAPDPSPDPAAEPAADPATDPAADPGSTGERPSGSGSAG